MNPVSPFPSCIRKIGIAATSMRPEEGVISEACGYLRSLGVEPMLAPHVFESGEETYFAADDRIRAEDLNSLIRDPEIDLVLCARGGYGAAYLEPLIDWEMLKKRNLPVCGYSDVTALHLAMLKHRAGIPVTTQMASRLPAAREDAVTMESMKNALERACGLKTEPQTASLALVSGSPRRAVTGPLVAANLCVMASVAGTPLMPDLNSCILLLEEIDEIPRKIDRMLLQLDLNGIFERVAAVVFGDYAGECGTQEERERIFRRFAARHPGTVFCSGLRFGHDLPSLSFVCGVSACLTESQILKF